MIWALPTAPADAVTAINLLDIDLGVRVVDPYTENFLTPPNTGSHDIGDLTGEAWKKSSPGTPDVYTYIYTVLPGIKNFSEFNTGFAVSGFNGIAGYLFSDIPAGAANPDGSGAFLISHDPDGTLDWNVPSGVGVWRTTPLYSIQFFFQSTDAPSQEGEGTFGVFAGIIGTSTSIEPKPEAVPEPSSLLLLGSGLIGLGWSARRRFKTTK